MLARQPSPLNEKFENQTLCLVNFTIRHLIYIYIIYSFLEKRLSANTFFPFYGKVCKGEKNPFVEENTHYYTCFLFAKMGIRKFFPLSFLVKYYIHELLTFFGHGILPQIDKKLYFFQAYGKRNIP
jgi:hypothetical protein